jgi:hypothetical protein
VDQIEALAVGPVAPMSQHQQSSWKASYNPANDRIAGLALLKSLGHSAGLPVYGTDRERRPFECESFDGLYQLC